GFWQGKENSRAFAAREVVVSGGTVNSPHLLQVSGIGPATHLQSIGVNVAHDLPGVGANLSDHFAARITHRVKDEVSINQMARGLKLVGEIVRYATTGRGALTFGVTTAMVFCRSREALKRPALHWLSTRGRCARRGTDNPGGGRAMTLGACFPRPATRATITAISPAPRARRASRPNFLSAAGVGPALLAGIGFARR